MRLSPKLFGGRQTKHGHRSVAACDQPKNKRGIQSLSTASTSLRPHIQSLIAVKHYSPTISWWVSPVIIQLINHHHALSTVIQHDWLSLMSWSSWLRTHWWTILIKMRVLDHLDPSRWNANGGEHAMLNNLRPNLVTLGLFISRSTTQVAQVTQVTQSSCPVPVAVWWSWWSWSKSAHRAEPMQWQQELAAEPGGGPSELSWEVSAFWIQGSLDLRARIFGVMMITMAWLPIWQLFPMSWQDKHSR